MRMQAVHEVNRGMNLNKAHGIAGWSRWLDFERHEPAYRLQYTPGSGQPFDSYGI